MTEKRRDNRGRILKTRESQRKDGRYVYKYKDAQGSMQTVYSWKLMPSDKLPAGKRPCISLREKERDIHRDVEDGINLSGKKMTLCQLYAKRNGHRVNVKPKTRTGRKYLMDILRQDKLGNASIGSIKPSDAKEWAIRMKQKGYAYKTINNFKRSLKASFYIAVEDDWVRKNPFDFCLNAVLEDDCRPKTALSEEEEEKLLHFVKHDSTYNRYYDDILLLLKTGLRISEFCGLTVSDLDFDRRIIRIDHQLQKNAENGYYIETPKTKSSIRQVPMSGQAAEAFRRVINRSGQKQEIAINGYSDFLFLNRKGLPMTASGYAAAFKNLTKKYNKIHESPIPNITPHVLRHTFCTRLANRNMNPKSLQYVMGHANINLTLNLYVHASIETVKTEMDRLMP
ncbi:MAG: tyrosine-type recombinase/integrase [Emergencia sp.]